MSHAFPYRTALIVGAGAGLSASLARALTAAGVQVGLAARNPAKLAPLAEQIGARTYAVDASGAEAVAGLFQAVDASLGEPDVVIYNASGRSPGPLVDLDPEAVRRAIEVAAFGGFLVTQQAARRMLKHRHGAILLTGATASVKGFARSAAFAMGKFALRGLAQSAARELAPQGIHVAHVVIDGGIRSATRGDPADRPDSTLDPDAIAETYLALLRQPRNAWSWEIEVRPWVETF
ncbi:NADP-dependent 3-hydroxy acid dehydrogenase YdfG [Stella humosa]|uniref:NADP-dependent 3-hydroxy acid dehydrogenase YdfG n=1 Tax=Stella humosa TaxID=94 RepID=A0A3N1MJB6_9PROT|nr:SDR family NAD(P)-dependent oxidoreductase [Stella humosa]ROQ01166.1 NADP-dependent 3-hydroxy acid dehydrogenase YdfG [Stella humosa]BBK31541.1 SDR family oxidoreductase [Stella humosa]